MIKSFQQIIEYARNIGPRTIAVAAAEDRDVLMAVDHAYQEGIADSILIGDKEKIAELMKENDINKDLYEIIDEKDKKMACYKAVQLVKTGQASLIMKGFVDTSVILKAILDKETGLKIDGLLSHVGVLKTDKYDRFFIISDSAMNISPTLEEKVSIINNAVKVAHVLENPNPKVAILCPVEKVNEKILSTVHAAELMKMNEEGRIKGCMVAGPLALDNAVSPEAAEHKGIKYPVAGQADILIAPNLEAGNILNKAIEYFSNVEKAGVIMGASSPVILTSRASSAAAKLNSIALAVLISGKTENSVMEG